MTMFIVNAYQDKHILLRLRRHFSCLIKIGLNTKTPMYYGTSVLMKWSDCLWSSFIFIYLWGQIIHYTRGFVNVRTFSHLPLAGKAPVCAYIDVAYLSMILDQLYCLLLCFRKHDKFYLKKVSGLILMYLSFFCSRSKRLVFQYLGDVGFRNLK